MAPQQERKESSGSKLEGNSGRSVQLPTTASYHKGGPQVVRPTWRRFIVPLLFTLNRANTSYQWLHIPASTTKAVVMYEVDNYAINSLAMIFMVVFIVFGWPA